MNPTTDDSQKKSNFDFSFDIDTGLSGPKETPVAMTVDPLTGDTLTQKPVEQPIAIENNKDVVGISAPSDAGLPDLGVSAMEMPTPVVTNEPVIPTEPVSAMPIEAPHEEMKIPPQMPTAEIVSDKFPLPPSSSAPAPEVPVKIEKKKSKISPLVAGLVAVVVLAVAGAAAVFGPNLLSTFRGDVRQRASYTTGCLGGYICRSNGNYCCEYRYADGTTDTTSHCQGDPNNTCPGGGGGTNPTPTPTPGSGTCTTQQRGLCNEDGCTGCTISGGSMRCTGCPGSPTPTPTPGGGGGGGCNQSTENACGSAGGCPTGQKCTYISGNNQNEVFACRTNASCTGSSASTCSIEGRCGNQAGCSVNQRCVYISGNNQNEVLACRADSTCATVDNCGVAHCTTCTSGNSSTCSVCADGYTRSSSGQCVINSGGGGGGGGGGTSPTPTPGGACAGPLASCESQACCSGQNLYCMGVAGSRKCQQDDGSLSQCPGGGTCGGSNGYYGFKCNSLSGGQCNDNGRRFDSFGAAAAYAGGCGQADTVCVGGTNDGNYCGDFTIFNSSCGGGGGGGDNPTPVCLRVKLYVKVNDQWVTKTPEQIHDSVKSGDTIRLAVKGDNGTFTKGRFLINDADPVESTTIVNGEFVYDYTIPANGEFSIHGEVSQ